MSVMTIGQVARQAEVGVETLRFYEREGLIAPPPRRASGYREYPSSTVGRVRFIKRAKALGFSLKEIRELLSLSLDPGTTCLDIKKRAEVKIEDIQQKIQSLQRMKWALQKLTQACDGKGAASHCPILDALNTPQEASP